MPQNQINSLNHVTRIARHDCAAPPYIYVETFAPAFLYLIVWLLLFDMKDVTITGARRSARFIDRDAARPGRKHIKGTKRRQAHRVRPKFIFGTRFFFRIISLTEWTLFSFQLIAVVDQFSKLWSGLVNNSVFCQHGARPGPLQKEAQITQVPTGSSWGPMSFGKVIQNRSNWQTTTGDADLPPGTYDIVVAQTLVPLGHGTVDVEFRLVYTGDLGDEVIDHQEATFTGETPNDIILAATFGRVTSHTNRIRWEYRWNTIGGFADIEQSDLVISAHFDAGPFIQELD